MEPSILARLLFILLRRQSQNINLAGYPATERIGVEYTICRKPSREGRLAPLVLEDLARGRLVNDMKLVELGKLFSG